MTARRASQPALSRERKILLVEDNPDDEKLTLRALKKNGIANPVVVARDGAEALELLIGSRATDFGLVLLDLRLPRVHGLEVLERMRRDPRTRLVPVIILTASREEIDIVRGYSLHANSYIAKPVEFGRFVEAVSALGIYWLALNESPPSAAIMATP
jgi:two-component system response regulator